MASPVRLATLLTMATCFGGASLAVGACSGTAVLDGSGAGGDPNGSGCAARILPVTCRAEPPACPAGQFPASDGTCWTGECLDCIDGCQSSDECVVVEACGCSYHEGCSWAETSYRAVLLDPCVRLPGESCSAACPASVCGGFECPWCDADGASCEAGRCQAVVSHMCM